MPNKELTIGELATAAGVATSVLRYWEEVGLLPVPARVSGQRRYPAMVVALVGLIMTLRDAGFRLREIEEFISSRADGPNAWRDLARRKLTELDERIAQTEAARSAISHALACKHPDLLTCPTSTRVIEARLAGTPLAVTHPH